jgi:hypothetical protein
MLLHALYFSRNCHLTGAPQYVQQFACGRGGGGGVDDDDVISHSSV